MRGEPKCSRSIKIQCLLLKQKNSNITWHSNYPMATFSVFLGEITKSMFVLQYSQEVSLNSGVHFYDCLLLIKASRLIEEVVLCVQLNVGFIVWLWPTWSNSHVLSDVQAIIQICTAITGIENYVAQRDEKSPEYENVFSRYCIKKGRKCMSLFGGKLRGFIS